MICHKNKIIFIHITKCAGSSVESIFGYKPFNILQSNRNNLLGWDDELKLYLQHISISDINKYDKYFNYLFKIILYLKNCLNKIKNLLNSNILNFIIFMPYSIFIYIFCAISLRRFLYGIQDFGR